MTFFLIKIAIGAVLILGYVLLTHSKGDGVTEDKAVCSDGMDSKFEPEKIRKLLSMTGMVLFTLLAGFIFLMFIFQKV